jgi:hypothetical protein
MTYPESSASGLFPGRASCFTLAIIRPKFRLGACLLATLLFMAARAPAAGTWSALLHSTPTPPGSGNGNPQLMLLLSDGTVIVQNDATGSGGTNYMRLTPDIHGSYVNGTWSLTAPANYTRAGCASDVMTNGKVFFAGGEYGTGYATSEVYDPVSNIWTIIPVSTNLIKTNGGFSDAMSVVIANGDVLVAPVSGATSHETMLFNPATSTFSAGPTARGNQNEASWVKLADGSILTIDAFGQNSERYIPALNSWVADATVPVVLYVSGEEAPAFLLPDGRAIFVGGGGNTAIYTPSGTIAAGSWVAGPVLPTVATGTGTNTSTNAQGCVDAPAAMMVNGKILYTTGPAGTYNGPICFFEYNYLSNSFTQINGPSSGVTNGATYYTKMLDLPSGQVLWNIGTSTTLYVYTPDGTPLTNGKPVINSITENADGSYHLTGLGLNGISQGASYGDDAQMDTSFPLVRLTSGVSTYYARTYNWSSTAVMTSNKVMTTEFSLPAGLAPGTYSLVEVANGNASDAVKFTFPLTTPGISSFNLSGSNLVINASNGLAGRTYQVLTSADTTLPLSQWISLATNVPNASGPFTITATNTVNPGDPQRYFTLQAQ